MSKTIIIAEAGVNHNGDILIAKKLIDAAADAGADYVKFQTFVTEQLVDKSAPKAEYQSNQLGESISQFEMIKKLELSFDQFDELKVYCDLKKIKFLTTVADFVSLKEIDRHNLDFIKISSGEVTNHLFLSKVAKKLKPIVMSTGMCTLGEIEEAISILMDNGITKENITILHCNTEYPTPFEDVNLYAMKSIANAFKIKTGYSDHTIGIEVPIAAVALGATVIEKHFTLDRNMIGPDHISSLEPNELKEMICAIRNVESAISGDGIKKPSASEKKNIDIVRKSLFASRDIKMGKMFEESDFILKRPGDGVPVKDIYRIIGRFAAKDIKNGHKLNYNDILW